MVSSLLSLVIMMTMSMVVKVSVAHASHMGDESLLLLPDSEAETLFRIMESMSSDQSWRASYPNPCHPDSSWPGIECKSTTADGDDENGTVHVSRLDFGDSPYPTCKKASVFPSLIFSLPHLRSAFFFNCFTRTKTGLNIPNSSGGVSTIQQLSLRSNPALVGPIPPQISRLKSLKILTLSQNRLSGTIPPELFSLTSLVHLDLSYNALNGTVSDALGGLTGLVGLDLSYNDLSGSITPAIGQLSQLQKVDLSSNRLTGGIPQPVEKLTQLAFMALSNNLLSEDLPKGMQALGSLQYFIMEENPMSMPLPPWLGDLARLQELRLANSGYSGDIPETLSRLKNLTTLSLQNNRLTGEIPSGFGGLPHIYHLNLSRNHLSGTVPFNASFLNRLGRNLDLSGNPGLCLSSSEAYSVKIGVTVCGAKNNNNGSLKRPLENGSRASMTLLWVSHKLLLLLFALFMALI